MSVILPTGDIFMTGGIKHVHLIRCGSVTHAFDADQRLLNVEFTKINSTTLEVTVPFMPEIMPPGRYMLWVVNNQGLPCQWAPFIRISKQKALFSVDFDKFAKSEVDAFLAAGTPAIFNNAVYLVYDGFLPGEVETPTFTMVWKDDNSTVPGIITTVGKTKYEGGVNNKDVAQRITCPVNVQFTSAAAFDAITDGPNDPGFREIVIKSRFCAF